MSRGGGEHIGRNIGLESGGNGKNQEKQESDKEIVDSQGKAAFTVAEDILEGYGHVIRHSDSPFTYPTWL